MKSARLLSGFISNRANHVRCLPTRTSLIPNPTQLHTSSKQNDLNSDNSAGAFPESLECNVSTVSETLSSFSNDYDKALKFFHWVEANSNYQHCTETYNKMIDILGKFFEFDTSWVLIREMGRDWFSMPNYTTFRIMFKRYALAHMVQEAIDTFYQLDEFGMRDETSFCNLIDALCESKHVMEAEELCRKEPAFVGGKTKIYNIIFRGWMKLEWWGKCKEFWAEMDKIGIQKDLVSYSIYMNIQCKCKKPWKAVKVFEEMKRKGIKLDTVAYNTVVHAIGLHQGVDFSIRLYKEMMELGCKPNVVTYNTIIKLLCENGRMSEAYMMLHEMSKKGCEPNVATYNCIFRTLVRPNEILKLFKRMIESGVQPRLDTYVMLMRKFGRWGFLRPVYIIWNKMEEMNCSPDADAYNALIDALIQKGMLDMARKYDAEMLEKGLSPKPRKELAVIESGS